MNKSFYIAIVFVSFTVSSLTSALRRIIQLRNEVDVLKTQIHILESKEHK